MQFKENIEIFNETPFTLNQPFRQHQDIIVVEIYLLEYQQNDKCLILVPNFIKNEIPVIVYAQKTLNEFDNAFLNIKHQGAKEITTLQFQQLLKIHYKFFEIILFKLDENAKNIFNDFFVKVDTVYNYDKKDELQKSLYRDFRFKNYLVLPIINPEENIDLQKEIEMYKIRHQKMHEIREQKINYELDVYKNPQLGKIYKVNNSKQRSPYFIYLYNIGTLENFTLQEYLNILSQTSYRYLNEEFTSEYFLKKLENYYNLQFTFLKSKSLKELIQDNFCGIGDNKEFNFLYPFQELNLKCQIDNESLDHNYLLGVRLPKIRDLDYQQIENFQKAFLEKDPYRMLMERTLDPEFIYIYKSDDIKYQGFDCKHFNGWVKNIALLKSFERSILINEMSMHFKLDYIDFYKVIIAMTPKQMFKSMNYENYETIGDSILKFFTITYGIKKFPNYSEGEVSELKSKLVSNLNLRKKAIQYGYHYFMRAFKQNILDYIPPYYKINQDMIEETSIIQSYLRPHKIGKKAIADQMESLIGAAYYQNQRLFESFKFLKSIKIYEEEEFKSIGKIMFERIEIEDDIIEQVKQNNDNFRRDICWDDLFFMNNKNDNYDYYNYKQNIFHSENQSQNFDDELQKFQDRIGYQYNDKNLLVNSLTVGTKTFEKLELLGDAVLDLYCQLSLVKIANENGFKLFPEKIHSLKVFMLSFEPLTLFSYFLDLPKYIEFISQEQYNKVYEFFEQVDVNQQVKYLWNKNEKIAPKCVSDAFEAFIGGLFLDQGFSAVKQILDKPFANYIHFYVHNFSFILIDIKQYIIHQYEKKGIQAQFKEQDDCVQLVVKDKSIIEYPFTENETVKSLQRKICIEFFENQDKYLNYFKKRYAQLNTFIILFNLSQQVPNFICYKLTTYHTKSKYN